MKTILVVGASGFIGSNVVNHFRKRYKVIASFNKNIIYFPGLTHTVYALSERDYMKRLLMLTKPDIIIYCAGVNDFAECAKKPRITEAVNSLGAVAFSAAADALQHRLIYLSTAYVYDGKKGNYIESDVMFPETHYGKGKLAGENYVRSKALAYTIFRFSPVIGFGSIYHLSEFDKIRMKLEYGERIELPESEVHSFLFIDALLRAIEWSILNDTENVTYNLGGLTKVSWYDLGVAIAESFGFDRSLLIPGRGQFGHPTDFSLNGSEFIRKSEIDPLILQQSLDLLKQKMIR